MPPLYGWIPPEDRTPEQHAAHAAAVAAMPEFKIVGDTGAPAPDKVVLWDFSKAVNNGKHFQVFHQQTGSCVGNGGGQTIWYLSAVEAVRLKQPIEAKLPFYLLTYGRSRYYSGSRGRGEGSSGSGFAQAAREDGIISADEPGLPQWKDADGITWGSSVEMQWSDGGSISSDWLNKSRKHLVKTTALCKDHNDVRAAIQNLYPCTIASNWGGQMSPAQKGSPAVLLNRHATSWNHQMCIIGWWNHPSLGEIFYILNSWGPDAHGTPPDDAPPGGFWVLASDVDYIARQGETFAFSQFDGFPSQNVSWYL